MLNDHSLVLDVNGPRSGIGSRAFKGDIPGLKDSQRGNACSLDSLKIFHFSLVPQTFFAKVPVGSRDIPSPVV